mmetsp:Transcript_66101/g.157868  ORF Transcript_66101/g.157868 Transcript_66101/m.157868 type:complete len:231 (+) Transcript_66101:2074-2766(+)
MNVLLQNRGDLRGVGVLGDGRRGLLGDDQRCARLVDHDRVSLVHDAEVERPRQHHLLLSHGEVVAEVVKPKLRVRHVREIAEVVLAALVRRLVRLDQPYREPEEPVDLADVLGIALREVVVHRHDVHALPRKRVEIRREGRHERLALASRHLRKLALLEAKAADQLDVVVPHLEHAPRRLAHHRERLIQNVVLGLALGEPRPEHRCLRREILVRHLLQSILQRVHLLLNP